MFLVEARRVVIVVIGSLLLSLSLNFFLIGANVYASGFTGAAQLIASIFQDFLNIQLSTGILFFLFIIPILFISWFNFEIRFKIYIIIFFFFLFNISVLIVGWFKVGKSFTIYSIISVSLASLFLEIIPIIAISNDIILNAVAGGFLSGAGIGITLKWGASTGGMDIVALVL